MRWHPLPAVLACLMLSTAPARATDADAARDELKAGYELKQVGRCPEALPHFLAALRLDPNAKALLNLSDCEQHLGQLVEARAHAADGRELARRQNDVDLVAAATEQLAGIERRLPHLMIRLEATAPAATTVSIDGATVDSSRLGVPEAVNPGKHVITASAPGSTSKTFEVSLSEGAARRSPVRWRN